MKKERFLILMICFLSAGMIFFGIASQDVSAASIEMKLAHFGANDPGDKDSIAVNWFVDQVEKRTNGKVKVKVFWSQSLAKALEMPRAIKSGLADMGPIQTPVHSELFPYAMSASQGAMLLRGAKLGEWIEPYRKFYNETPQERDCYKRQNMKLLAFWEYDEIGLISKVPIRNFEDGKGLKVRTSGYVGKLLKAGGFVPINIHGSEIYDALNKGLIVASHAPKDMVLKYKFYEVCKYYTEIPVFGTILCYAFTINLDTFNKLPKDVRDEMVKIGEELTNMMPGVIKGVGDKFIEKFKNVGGTIITFDENDQREWAAKSAKPAMDFYIKSIEDKGIPMARENVHKFAEMMNYKWQ